MISRTKHRVVTIETNGQIQGSSKLGFSFPLVYILPDGRRFNGRSRFNKKKEAVAALAKYPRQDVKDTALIFEDGAWTGVVLWAPFGLDDAELAAT